MESNPRPQLISPLDAPSAVVHLCVLVCIQRTTHTSRMQNLALQVGHGTRLESQVSGLC